MILGDFTNPIIDGKLSESQSDLDYTLGGVDERGRRIININGDVDEFFKKLGYHRAEDVEKEFMNIQNENDK